MCSWASPRVFPHKVAQRANPDGAAVRSLVRTIEQAGGTVTHRFKHVSGIAADVPDSALGADRDAWWARTTSAATRSSPCLNSPIRAAASSRAKPRPTTSWRSTAPGVSVEPANYIFNATLTNVAPLHAAGHIGTGIVIAVIDSGYRPIMHARRAVADHRARA